MKYDTIVVGAGPGGYIAAIKAAENGFKTMIIEKKYMGGVCLNVGCIPTKTLLKSSKIYDIILHADKYGIELPAEIAKINWKKMQTRKETVVKKLVGAIEFLMKKNKIDVVRGNAKAINKTSLSVDNETYEFKNLILANGSIPRHLPLSGFEEARKRNFLLDSTTLLSLKELPKSMITIGGGVIGMEFSFMMAELGVDVSILQGLPTILELLDTDISNEMTKIAKKKNIKIIPNAMVKGVDNKTNEVLYEIKKKEHRLKADKVLESVGRIPHWPSFKNINLKTGVMGSIVVNEYMQTNIENIYAIGDVTAKSMLAHTASAQAVVAVKNIIGQKTAMSYHIIPNCIYTHPEVATVGLTETEAKKQKLEFVKFRLPLSTNGKALADGEEDGFVKIIAGKKYKEIIGVHIICSSATDMISEISTLMTCEGTIDELVDVIHPHPTISETIYSAATQVKMLNNK